MDRSMSVDAALLYPEHGSNFIDRTEHRYGDIAGILLCFRGMVDECGAAGEEA